MRVVVYRQAFALNQMGMEAAWAVAMMAILLVFMVGYIRRTRDKEAY